MSRSALEYLRHILEEAEYLMTMAQGLSQAQFISHGNASAGITSNTSQAGPQLLHSVKELGTLAEDEPGNFPLQFLDAALGLLEGPSKLVRIKSNTTLGTGITIAFEPADVLLALVTALRTGNLDSFLLEHGRIRALLPLDFDGARRCRVLSGGGMSGYGMMLCLSVFLIFVLSSLAFRFVLEIFLVFFLLCFVAHQAV